MFVPGANTAGSGCSCVDAVLVLEELGAADVGIASDYFSLTATMPLMMLRAGTDGAGLPLDGGIRRSHRR